MKFKRFWAGVIASVIAASVGAITPVCVSAEYKGLIYDDNLYYLKIDKDKDDIYDYAVITDCNESAVSVNIPSEIGNLPVTRIGDSAFLNCNDLTTVSIPDTVTVIEQYAFSCTSLTEINFPKKLAEIGESAFAGCSMLQSINIPNTVKAIGNEAFARCEALNSVSLGKGLESIGNIAFADCKSLSGITISENVQSIGESAFENCESFSEITIPDSVQSIGMNAFQNTPLEDNQEGIKYADTWVISCDKNYASIEIKDGTRGIAQYAFTEYDGLEEVFFPDTLKTIDSYAFSDCPNLRSISTGNGVEKICSHAFYNCTSLKSVVMGNSVETIEEYAFKGCTKLEDITIPQSVENIIGNAFEDTPWLETKRNEDPYVVVNSVLIDAQTIPLEDEITIPEDVKTIGSYAFQIPADIIAPTKDITVILPEYVTKIEQYGFYGFADIGDLIIKNPDCEIIDNGYIFKAVPDEYGVSFTEPDYGSTVCFGGELGVYFYYGTIYGYENSTAQAYAELCGYSFESLGEYTPSWNISDVVKLQNFLLRRIDNIGRYYDLNNDSIINVFDLIFLKRKVIYG